MCDTFPKYSCSEAPIDSNVVPAWDEHYRRDQTHVPGHYQTVCEGEQCDEQLVEGMHGGRRGGRRHRRGGWRRWRGFRGGGWYPSTYWYNPVPYYVPVPTPVPRRPSVNPWLLPIGATLAVIFLATRK